MSTLQITWFGLIGVLLAGYIILDGFDLGVGFWHLFAKKESDRRAMMSSIMPYWDGNEVWLLTGGGAVFAAFPNVYATVFSGFYLALMVVLFALIFRAVSIEFRNQSDSAGWKRFWDGAFALGSIVPALLFGVALGNILRGLPLNELGDYTGTFFMLLNPYSLLVGVTGLAMFAMHGALFLVMKTDGEIASRARRWAIKSGVLFGLLFASSIAYTLIGQRNLIANFSSVPALWALPMLALAAAWVSPVLASAERIWAAFIASSACMLLIIATSAAALFPNWVPAINNPSNSLTIANASSSPLTLKTMLILAIIGVPLVLVYTVWVHMMFRGKVTEETEY
jgi:cytochrome d ubiquinol oxidase subunit II